LEYQLRSSLLLGSLHQSPSLVPTTMGRGWSSDIHELVITAHMAGDTLMGGDMGIAGTLTPVGSTVAGITIIASMGVLGRRPSAADHLKIHAVLYRWQGQLRSKVSTANILPARD